MLVSLLLLFMFLLFWVSNSLIIQILTLMVSVIINSLIVFFNFQSSTGCYLILLSIISGLIVVMSFVMFMYPNISANSKYPLNLLIIIPFIVLMSIIMGNGLDENILKFSSNLTSEFLFFNHYVMIPYLLMFLFLALILLVMLFILDYVIASKVGSMLPKVS